MALILLNTGRLPVVQDLNAFEQIFHKLLRDSVLRINYDYIKHLKIILEFFLIYMFYIIFRVKYFFELNFF